MSAGVAIPHSKLMGDLRRAGPGKGAREGFLSDQLAIAHDNRATGCEHAVSLK
jgi:hypothetical protein